jgi:two-component system chemotaxis response regulator CheB
MNTDPCLAARVLIVDDSALCRKLLKDILSADPRFEVVGVAHDGREALDMARSLHPDVITLDVEMPVMNGPECLEALMAEIPTPVLIVSSLTHEGSDAAIACLQRGAVDVILKPQGPGAVTPAFAAEVVSKAAAAAFAQIGALPLRQDAEPVRPDARRENPACAKPPMGRPIGSTTAVVTIAASTGGPAALMELIPGLPADLDAAYVLVQHLPAGFSRRLAERLDRISAIAVREGADGDHLGPGLALLAPGGCHLELDGRRRVALNTDPPLWGVRPAADVTLNSVAHWFGNRSVAVVLTGMGRDGTVGARAVHSSGGTVLAQDKESSLVYGMPRAVAEAGAVDRVVPISKMAGAIADAVQAITARRAA